MNKHHFIGNSDTADTFSLQPLQLISLFKERGNGQNPSIYQLKLKIPTTARYFISHHVSYKKKGTAGG